MIFIGALKNAKIPAENATFWHHCIFHREPLEAGKTKVGTQDPKKLQKTVFRLVNSTVIN